ncbi:hypothetical protein SB766_07240 [Pseudomonas sp. SIMBA_077]
MAKPNYNFAKRQRDLAKEQKKEEKLARKKAAAEAGNVEHLEEVDAEQEVVEDGTDAAHDPVEKA